MQEGTGESHSTRAEAISAGRLDSWKEIAAYLKRDVRTVQRWEKRDGIPIHRVFPGERAPVFAYRSELDEWFKSRSENQAQFLKVNSDLDAPRNVGAPDPRRSSFRWRLLYAALLFVGAVGAIAVPFWRKAGSSIAKSPPDSSPGHRPAPVDQSCMIGGVIHAWIAENNGADPIGGDDATFRPTVQIVPGVTGKAFSLDGHGAGLTTSVHALPPEFTIACWVRFNRYVHGPDVNVGLAPPGDMSILDKMQPSPIPNVAGWLLLKQHDNRIWFCLGSGSDGNRCWDRNYTLFSRGVVQLHTWYFVSVAKSAQAMRLYINRELNDERRLPHYRDSETPLLLGWSTREGAHLDGDIADVMIFDRALGDDGIGKLYAAQADGRCSAATMVAR